MKIIFEIWGIPKGQGRPRAYVRKGKPGEKPHAGVYDPPLSREWKDFVFRQIMAHRPKRPMEGPIRLRLIFRMPMVTGLKKTVRQMIESGREVYHTKRPDIDQVGKPIMDCLEAAGYYYSDSQVAESFAKKIYGVRPGVRVEIEEYATFPP